MASVQQQQQQQLQHHHYYHHHQYLNGEETREHRVFFPSDKMEIQRQPRESKRKRFKPWENLRRMFQRKNSTASEHQATAKGRSSSSSRLSGVFGLAGSSSRSRSTSELLTTEPQAIPVSHTSTSNSRATVGAGSLGAGLSVSHDSVFGLDISPESDVYSPQHHHRHHQTSTTAESLPSSASLQYMSELRAAIGVRHRSTEEDEGLPRSPISATPTTAQILLVDSSIHNNVVHSGGGSDPSLLSLNSCELDEAPFAILNHGRNSQESQQQAPQPQQQQQPGKFLQRASNNNNESIAEDVQLDGSVDDGLLPAMAASLNHSAARHKISIRPKRNHAPARPRQLPQLAEGSMEEDLQTWSSHPIGEDDDHRQQQHPSVPERKNRIARLIQRGDPVSAVKTGNSSALNQAGPTSYIKPRSISLSRTEDCAIREAPLVHHTGQVNDPARENSKPSAGSSSVKLARSKSTVEKKIQHEVAVFWRRTKEGKLFQRKESPEKETSTANLNQDVSIQPVESEVKRKDLRKIKRDKEEKRKRSDASNSNKEDSSPPFLSRIFGSRRSSRRLRKNKTPTPPSPQLDQSQRQQTPSPIGTIDSTEPVPVPKPRTVFTHSPVDCVDDEEMEIDWRIPHQPYSYVQPSTSRPLLPSVNVPQPRLAEKWSEMDHFVRPPPMMTSPKLSRTEESHKSSPLPSRHHRIHIAGLSPYQRRVARIGNDLEISDDEWDQPEPAVSPTRSYHFRVDDGRERSDLSLNLDNKSLPANINHDFILKRPSPVQSPPTTPAATNNDQLRRSFEILKYSNEGLKKTIDSLNPKRMSQSSDHLHLSDGSGGGGGGQRESCGSVSNSTSSLNISDADDTVDMNGSMISLIQSADEEKDVRDDVLIVDDHKETIQSTGWIQDNQLTELSAESDRRPSPLHHQLVESSGSSSHPGLPEFISVQLNRRVPASTAVATAVSPTPSGLPMFSAAYENTEIRSKPPTSSTTSPKESIKPKHKSLESRQVAAPLDPPMFSMSVRVQNPPDVKFKRSLSTPSSQGSLSLVQQQENGPEIPAVRKLSDALQPARPFIMSVRMGTDGDGTPTALPAQQLMAKLSARPWQSKEEKDRQNKVALTRSQQELQLESEPALASATISNNKTSECNNGNRSCTNSSSSSSSSGSNSSNANNGNSAISKTEETEIAAAAAAEVKLRPKKAAQEETSELLKVFARRSLKVRDSRDLTDVANFTISTEPEVSDSSEGSVSPNNRPLHPHQQQQQQQQQLDDTATTEVGHPTEKTDLSKDKMPCKIKMAKPPVAVRSAIGPEEKTFDPSDRAVLKSSGRAPTFFRAGIHESNSNNNLPESNVPSVRPSGPLFIRPVADDKSVDPLDQNWTMTSSTTINPATGNAASAVAVEKVSDLTESSDTNRISDSYTLPATPDEVVWKRHQPKPPRPADRFVPAHKFAASKTIDEEVKAATAVPPTRQSKVLDMVHNFQRLQVT